MKKAAGSTHISNNCASAFTETVITLWCIAEVFFVPSILLYRIKKKYLPGVRYNKIKIFFNHFNKDILK